MNRVLSQRVWLFAAIASAAVAADLSAKHWVFANRNLLGGQVQWVVRDHIGFQLSLNEGGLFGMGQGSQAWLAGFSVLAALAIPVWLFYYGAAADRLLTIALAGVMGGVLGNLYDRLGFHGLMWNTFDPSRAGQSVYAVRDFILFAWKWDVDPASRIAWPNFNLADTFLVIGAATLFYRAVGSPTESIAMKNKSDSAEQYSPEASQDNQSEYHQRDPRPRCHATG